MYSEIRQKEANVLQTDTFASFYMFHKTLFFDIMPAVRRNNDHAL